VEPFDALILLAFVSYAVASGLVNRRAASRSLSEYFLAGRSLSGTRAGLSMAATQFSADTPLLVTGLIATTGIFGLWRLWIYALSFLLLGYLLAPCWRRAGVITDAELSELRYGGRAALALRAVKAVYFGLIFNTAVLAMVLFAAARIAEPFLVWHAWLPASVFEPVVSLVRAIGVPLSSSDAGTAMQWVHSADNLISLLSILLLTTFYSTTGGLRSVVRTDTLQLALALAGTAVYAFYVVDAAGGFSGIAARLPDALRGHPNGLGTDALLAFTPGPAREVSTALLAVLGLQWLIQMNSDGTGYLAQRCMACRSDADATRATLVFAWVQIFVRSLLWLPIGIGLLVIFAPTGSAHFTAEREASYVRGMVELLPPGMRGLLLTAMLAALTSTLDTHLNWGASYLANDLYARVYCGVVRRREPRTTQLVGVARLSNLLIVALSLGIMTQLSSIQTAWQISLLLGAGMGVMLLLRWLWWRITAGGELACIAASSVLAPILIALLPGEREALRLLLVALGATLAGVAVSLAQSPPSRERLREFYARVQPPGFWRPVALELGDDPERSRQHLQRGLLRTGAAALSLFCALVGVGSWLVGGTVPAWFPVSWLWSPTLLAIALALVPLYLERSRRES